MKKRKNWHGVNVIHVHLAMTSFLLIVLGVYIPMTALIFFGMATGNIFLSANQMMIKSLDECF